MCLSSTPCTFFPSLKCKSTIHAYLYIYACRTLHCTAAHGYTYAYTYARRVPLDGKSTHKVRNDRTCATSIRVLVGYFWFGVYTQQSNVVIRPLTFELGLCGVHIFKCTWSPLCLALLVMNDALIISYVNTYKVGKPYVCVCKPRLFNKRIIIPLYAAAH